MRVIRGVVVLLVAVLATASCSSDAPPPKPDKPSASAKPKAIEVKDAVFVLNPDQTATLSAKVVNGTGVSFSMTGIPQAVTPSGDYPYVSFYNPQTVFRAGETTLIGHDPDGIRIRLRSAPAVGTEVSLDLSFFDEGANQDTPVTLKVPIVARTSKYDSVVMPRPNTKIKVKDGKIVVIAGQKKAYVSGIVVASIEDRAWTLPTAVNSKGDPVEYKHQTATGGPYGLISLKDREFRFGGPPYTTSVGDADYFDAKDVTIGEKITVTIPFESGDVRAIFTVVRG